MRLRELAGRNVVVWGSGLEGVAAANAALRQGAEVRIAVDDAADGPAEVATREGDVVKAVYGEAASAALLDAGVVIRSPSIPPANPTLRRLADRGVPMTTGPALWLEEHAGRAIGITGTKGKSTTSSLLGHLMQAVGMDVVVGGNIGIPLLDLPEGHDWYVAEFSSYQAATVTRSPWAVLFTSLFPEHLNWHGSEESYYRDKLNLAAHEPGLVLANSENQTLRALLAQVAPPDRTLWAPSDRIAVSGPQEVCVRDGERVVRIPAPTLLGRHNLDNLCLSLLMLQRLGVDLAGTADRIRAGLESFGGLRHRLELVSRRGGMRWIDDTLATIPEATIAALTAFPDCPVTLIVGGTDRGVGYEPLRDHLRERTPPVHVLGMPESGPRILATLSGDGTVPHRFDAVDSLEEAVRVAAECTPEGGVVLLSPAAPRGRRFTDSDHRGRVFRESIERLDAPDPA